MVLGPLIRSGMRPSLLLLLVMALHCSPGLGDEMEYQLTRFLMDRYDASVRPVENASMPLQVTFGVSLHHIIDVDEKNQILTTNCWLTQIWKDHHLRWNQSEFNGINVVRIPFNRVWKPDLILYNNADSQYSTAAINTNVIVYSNGMVTWLSHGIYRSSCDIDVEFFPFDIQACNMKWASWTYDGYQLDLVKQTEDGDVSNYQANGEFDLVSFDAKKHVEYYSCCPEPYPDITYVIRIRRRPLFYVFNLILPCILINCIALLVFYVPSESGEKVTLGISALLSMTVFLMTIRESLPPTEKTPLISKSLLRRQHLPGVLRVGVVRRHPQRLPPGGARHGRAPAHQDHGAAPPRQAGLPALRAPGQVQGGASADAPQRCDAARPARRQVDPGGRGQRGPPADEPPVQRAPQSQPDAGRRPRQQLGRLVGPQQQQRWSAGGSLLRGPGGAVRPGADAGERDHRAQRGAPGGAGEARDGGVGVEAGGPDPGPLPALALHGHHGHRLHRHPLRLALRAMMVDLRGHVGAAQGTA